MANVRDSDTSLWLHNKLGTSNDSWISGSICSQLNKEVLRNIKDCFPDLQTQVKLKLLLSFFHIPRRLVQEWKHELEEIIEVAGLDSELWVSMLAETMKTFPATGSLNTEISEYEETRPIFTDMVNDLRKLVSKHCDLGMLPLECLYLNKNSLISVVGQQPNPVKHFTLKRKPKSVNLRTELLQKSSDAQSSLKKASAPTIPLRSRGMPRKMTDTTPLKGIPSRVPTSGFRSPIVAQNQSRPMIRTPAGRKDGGIKLIEFTEQPLGYAAAKKRKRQQEQEEQQKKAAEQKQAASVVTALAPTATTTTATVLTPTTTQPEYAPTLTYTTSALPTNVIPTTSVKEESVEMTPVEETKYQIQEQDSVVSIAPTETIVQQIVQTASVSKKFIKEEPMEMKTEILSPNQVAHQEQKQQIQQTLISTLPKTQIKVEKIEAKPVLRSPPPQQPLKTINTTARPSALANLPNNISVKITSTPKLQTQLQQPSQQNQQKPILINSSTPVILSSPPLQQAKQTLLTNSTQTTSLKSLPLATQLKSNSGGPMIISQTIIQPSKRNQSTQNIIVSSSPMIASNMSMIQTSGNTSNQNQPHQQLILSSSQASVPSLSSFSQSRQGHTIIQTSGSGPTQTPTKILLKTIPSMPMMMPRKMPTSQSNPPPLISTQQPTILNIQNVSLPNRAVTIQPASQAAQQQHLQAQLQQQQHQQQIQQTHTVVSNTNATQQPKLTQVVMSSQNNVKGKTIILPHKGVILRNIGGDMYQEIPISNVSNLQNLGGATIVTAGPPGLVKTSNAQTQVPKSTTQQMPALIPTNSIQQNIGVPSLTPMVIQHQQPQQQSVQTIIGNPPQQTLIRPVLANVQGGITSLPQGITLIQRPGQQAQLVQMQPQQAGQTQQMQRTIITQPQAHLRPQQIILQQKPQTIITSQQQQHQIIQVQQPAQQQPVQQTQRKGLSLSNEHIIKAHEMFRKANRVSRPDKALILGFMSGHKENPRPNSENVIVIKLGETEEMMKQEDGTHALCLVESHIRLDYNTGEWKTFQNFQRLDQSLQGQNSGGGIQTQNSVII